MTTTMKKRAPPTRKTSKTMTKKRPISSAVVLREVDEAAPKDLRTQIGKRH